MFVRSVSAIAWSLFAVGALAAPSPSAVPENASLTSAEIAQAIRTDSITIPTPGETFAALGKPAKPDWTSFYRGPIATSYKTRAQIALNLGGLIADGFIAVEAQDSQQVKNIGRRHFENGEGARRERKYSRARQQHQPVRRE